MADIMVGLISAPLLPTLQKHHAKTGGTKGTPKLGALNFPYILGVCFTCNGSKISGAPSGNSTAVWCNGSGEAVSSGPDGGGCFDWTYGSCSVSTFLNPAVATFNDGNRPYFAYCGIVGPDYANVGESSWASGG